MTRPLDGDAVHSFQRDFAELHAALSGAIVGQDALVAEVLTAVIAQGHVLLEGLPGLGKTQLARGLAHAIGERLARIQCTPDLLPSDITGSELLVRDDAGGQELRFRPGPIFAPLVLVDEINRATSRTQSALLEAMQERQVTYAGRAHGLPSLFWVIATQNPIELEGTYPLPEAQLDRFFYKCTVPYPSDATLLRIAEVALDGDAAERLEPVLPPGRLKEMIDCTRQVVIANAVRERAAALVLATQPDRESAGSEAREHIRYGASPRALQTLLRAARVLALADARGHVDVEDLREAALPALRHRVLLRLESEVDGVTVDALLERIVAQWRAG